MAQRRMFSKGITNSSGFLMMPQSAQNLYFHFGMNADDDGFCEHFPVMRMTDSKPDDLRVLQARGFVKIFDDKVLVIVDWKENNYIQKDRYTPSKYLRVYEKEMRLLTESKQDMHKDVYGMDTQVRLGKVRLGKDKEIAEANSAPEFSMIKEIEKLEENQRRDLNIIALYFREKKLSFENNQQLNVAIRRHLRAAKQLTPFSDKQIMSAAKEAQSQYPGLWTIETLLKIATR